MVRAMRLTAPHFALVLVLAGCGGPPKPAEEPVVGADGPGDGGARGKGDGKDASAEIADAEAAVQANDLARAKKAAAAALAKDPKNARGHYYAGLADEGLGDKAAAEKHYRDALAAAPGFADAAVNLSALLLDEKRPADAVAVLKPLAGKLGDDPLFLANYGAALVAAGEAGAAAPVFEKLAKRPDAKPEARLGWADALFAGGKKDEAAKVLRDALASAGESRDALAAIARRLGQVGAYEDAVKAMDRAIKQKASADLYTYRALFKRGLRDAAGAKADLEAAIKEDGKFAHAYVYLGEVLEELKKPADAKKAYEKAIELAPDAAPGRKAKDRLEAMKGKKP